MIKLNKNTIEAGHHYNAIKDQVERTVRRAIARDYVGRAPNRIYLTVDTRNYLNDLLVGTNLSDLINIAPDRLTALTASIGAAYPNFIISGNVNNSILRNIFISNGYDHASFSKLDFIKRVNVDTCPYCNRNYIYYLTKTSELKPQIDHFFPKTKYPFLALSYFNLIPSCQTCNGFGAKEEKDPIIVDLINPYLIETGNFKFTYKIRTINFLNPLFDKTSIEVKFRNNLPGHLNVFKLEKLYAQHSDHVLELIIKSKVAYSAQYRAYLHSYKGLKFNDDEIDRMILGNYSKEDEIHKRPLAKMYQDIGKQLGLIK